MKVLEYSYTKGNEKRVISYKGIEKTNWILGLRVNKKEYLVNFFNYFDSFIIIAVIILIISLLLGSYLFVRISVPISFLANEVQKISKGQFGKTINVGTGFTSNNEIHQLADSFNEMSTTIKDHTENLKEKQQQLEAIFNGIKGLIFICNRL